MENKFLVYENWRAKNKAVVHKYDCGYAKEGHEKHKNKWLINNHLLNGRWYAYFDTIDCAIAFAALLPNRHLRLCAHCLKNELKILREKK